MKSINSMIKYISAFGAGAVMLSASAVGALALADLSPSLSAYPAPFVKSGQWDGMIVVGSNAAASDVVGSIDIAAALQYEMKQSVSTGMIADPMINVGKKIEKTGDKFNYGDSIADISSALDNEDLPSILSDGVYDDQEGETDNKVDYTQSLIFTDGTDTLKHVRDRKSADEKTDNYLFIDDHLPAYTYYLEFDQPVSFADAADLEDTVFKIQGNEYTITSVSLSGSNVDKIELLAGETLIWLQQGKTIVKPLEGIDHEIMVTDVNDKETMCGISVDGDVVWVDKGNTASINGVEVGVSDAVAVHAQLQDVDVCKINIGATELTLKDGSEVKVNRMDIEGTEVEIDQSVANELGWLKIVASPDNDVYLSNGQTWTDPALGNFGIRFAGMSAKTELISAESNSDEASFTFVNNDGDEVEIPMIASAGNIMYGDGDNTDYPVTMSNGQMMALQNGDSCTGNVDATDCEGIKFLAISSGNEARLMEIGNIDLIDRTIDIKDITGGNSFDDRAFGTINLRLLQASITLSADNKTVTFAHIQDSADIDSKYLAGIKLGAAPGVTITEDDGNVISFDYAWDATDEDIEIRNLAGLVSMDRIEDGSDVKSGYSIYGSIAVYDSSSQDSLEISYPDSDAYGNVFIAPTSAFVTAAGELNTVTIAPIIGAAKLDTEVSDMDQNMIVVGGPCANSVAAKLMGRDMAYPACAAGFKDGSALIKLYQNGDKVAMLVAGYSAADTSAAAKVVATGGIIVTGPEMTIDTSSLSVSAPIKA